MKSIKFAATCGVNAGYNHNNEVQDACGVVARVWQEKARIEFENSGTYVGAVISPSLTVYNTAWGCPEGGEVTASISGVCNPEFTEVVAYRAAATSVLKAVAKELGQTTAQIEFTDCAFVYIKDAQD